MNTSLIIYAFILLKFFFAYLAIKEYLKWDKFQDESKNKIWLIYIGFLIVGFIILLSKF